MTDNVLSNKRVIETSNIPVTPMGLYERLKALEYEDPLLALQLIIDYVEINVELAELNHRNLFTSEQLSKLQDIWPAIEAKKPVQYIFGYTRVHDTKIILSEATLCPGPEIELLIRESLKIARNLERKGEKCKILDLCTGSGVIGVILAKELPDHEIYATDISDEAVQVAEKNRALYSLGNMKILKGDLFEPLEALRCESGMFDLIVSNPPYCCTLDIDSLPVQISSYAPRLAIDGGYDGLYFYERILAEAPHYLKTPGYLILENEQGQSPVLQTLLQQHGFSVVEVLENERNEERVISSELLKRAD